MAYIAPIHRASSVRHALQARLLSADEDSLILAFVYLSIVAYHSSYVCGVLTQDGDIEKRTG